MYTVKFTSAFKKNYKLMKKRGMDISLLDDVIEELRRGKELDENIKTMSSKVNMPVSTNVMLNRTGC